LNQNIFFGRIYFFLQPPSCSLYLNFFSKLALDDLTFYSPVVIPLLLVFFPPFLICRFYSVATTDPVGFSSPRRLWRCPPFSPLVVLYFAYYPAVGFIFFLSSQPAPPPPPFFVGSLKIFTVCVRTFLLPLTPTFSLVLRILRSFQLFLCIGCPSLLETLVCHCVFGFSVFFSSFFSFPAHFHFVIPPYFFNLRLFAQLSLRVSLVIGFSRVRGLCVTETLEVVLMSVLTPFFLALTMSHVTSLPSLIT